MKNPFSGGGKLSLPKHSGGVMIGGGATEKYRQFKKYIPKLFLSFLQGRNGFIRYTFLNTSPALKEGCV